MPWKSASDLVAPSPVSKVKSGRGSGFGRTTNAAIAPLFSPTMELGLMISAAVPAGSAGDSGAETGPEPLSEGRKLQYTVPNPAIAAITAAIAYLAGDAAC